MSMSDPCASAVPNPRHAKALHRATIARGRLITTSLNNRLSHRAPRNRRATNSLRATRRQHPTKDSRTDKRSRRITMNARLPLNGQQGRDMTRGRVRKSPAITLKIGRSSVGPQKRQCHNPAS
jgi:hypothetical protein